MIWSKAYCYCCGQRDTTQEGGYCRGLRPVEGAIDYHFVCCRSCMRANRDDL